MHIECIQSDHLDRLEPLWLELHAHHQLVAPETGPFVNNQFSWQRRLALYADTLRLGGAIFLASEDGEDCGYATWRPGRMPWPALINSPPRLAEVFSVLVRRDRRCAGVGGTLLAKINSSIAAAALPNQMVGVLPQNAGPVASYQRRGFKPAWLVMSRFDRDPRMEASTFANHVEPVAPTEVDALRPLVVSMHRHHHAIAPELAPFVSDEQSWIVFSRIMRAASADGLLFRVGTAQRPVAMICADFLKDNDEFADTWQTAGKIAEIEILSVSAEARCQGLGRALMHAMGARLHVHGIRDVILGAVASNARAIEFYRKLGFKPVWLQMIKFSGGVSCRAAAP